MTAVRKFRKKHVEEVSDLICNKCGHSCQVTVGKNVITYEYAHLTANWGYGSHMDGDSYEAHICETCFTKFIKTFLLPVRPNPSDTQCLL